MAAELVAFGDISIDVAVRIPHLPEPDEKLWVEVIGDQQGGMGANAAAAFAALGGAAALVAAVGNDAERWIGFCHRLIGTAEVNIGDSSA